MDEVGADHGIFGVTKNVFQVSFAGILHRGGDFVVAGALFCLEGQVHHRTRRGRDAERHAAQLALYLRTNEAHCLGGAGAGRDDVCGGGAAVTPCFTAWAVHGLLRGGVGVYGGHQALGDAKTFLEQHMHDRRETVGGAGGVGDDVVVCCVVQVVVDAHNDSQIFALGRCGDDDLLGACLDMALGFLALGKQTGGFNHNIHAEFLPRQAAGFAGADDFHFITVDD